MPLRGEVWWADLREAGTRPVVVIARQIAIESRGRTMIAPCSTVIRGLVSEVVLDPEDGDPLGRRCAVQLDAVVDVDVRVLTERAGRLSAGRMREVCESLTAATGC
ncbi:type II toxin-antitoxin system PemK/MazF family toxin [Brevibacterium album]|uniref:type II toxin-antitoxin system PemK/MazF family toxin n=1 Tax=Brevibacterium album TaxID=417948 RepID=UPI0003FD312E|nr:type II toxin-antitoxin system PemK/MazF family toxin [Brevibacterium album]